MKRRHYDEIAGLIFRTESIITTAKRLSPTAQGWRAATTLGSLEKERRNPSGVAEDWNRSLTQGSRQAATLGCRSQPLRG